MKVIRHVTAVLLLAAFAAVGCSNRGETLEANEDSPDSAVKPVTTPVTARGDSAKRGGEEDRVSPAVPTIPTSMSFGDGEAAYRARKYSQATAIFERYTGERPSNAWGHYILGLS